MPVLRFFGRLLNKLILGAAGVAIVAVVGMLLDKVLLGDQPRGRPGGSPVPPPPPREQ